MPEKRSNYKQSKTLIYLILSVSAVTCVLSVLLGFLYSVSSFFQFGVLQFLIAAFVLLFILSPKLEEVLFRSKCVKPPKAFEGPDQSKKKRFIKADIELTPEKMVKVYYNYCYPVLIILLILVAGFIENLFFHYFSNSYISIGPLVLMSAGCIILSFLFLFGANALTQSDSAEEYMIFSYFLKASQWFLFLLAAALILKYFGVDLFEQIIRDIIFVFICISLLEFLIQSVFRFMNGRAVQSPVFRLYVIPALVSGGNPFNHLLLSFEKKTGMSFRSTWTIRLIRENFLIGVLSILIFFWLMTAFVQINVDEEGILYHFGKISNERVLAPGIHLKWPYPINTVKIYKVDKIQSFNVGYEAGKNKDYLWTMGHGGEEYKLLLGDGKELVSVNMKVYYKIGDLKQYVMQYEIPEEKLKAEAYRILLFETVTTNLDYLLSRDRSSFAQTIEDKLRLVSKRQNLGIEVTDVDVVSIHPPIEVAQYYQQIVSANIIKETTIIKAQSYSDALIPKYEDKKNKMIAEARVEALTRTGEAKGQANRSLYELQAYQLSPSVYKEQKWLETLENSLVGKELYLIDKKLKANGGTYWLDIRGLNDGEIKRTLPDIDVELPPRD